MGGILYRYFTELMVEVGRARRWPLDRVPLGPTGPIDDPDYARLLAGEFDEPEYLRRITAKLAAEGIDFDAPRDLSWEGHQRDVAWKAVRRIHDAGHLQAILTNDASKWLGPNWWETWEPAPWFDAMVDVSTVGVRKPAPEPYLAAVDALRVPAAECLFIDDIPVNCRGAEAVGMSSHLFDVTEPDVSIDRLLHRIGVDAS
jgi:putative hydrolase of the HAD superfamily